MSNPPETPEQERTNTMPVSLERGFDRKNAASTNAYQNTSARIHTTRDVELFETIETVREVGRATDNLEDRHVSPMTVSMGA
jgi:hypothetical protein